ncbi:MAG: hypothetical protein QXN08_01220 [Nitrososphaerales archaeon]
MPENLWEIIDSIKRSLRDQQLKDGATRVGVVTFITTFSEKTPLEENLIINRYRRQLSDATGLNAACSAFTHLKGVFTVGCARVDFSSCG